MADQQFGVSRQNRDLIEAAAKRRALLRQEYIKLTTNPHRHATGEGGVLLDTGVQRFMAMRATQYEHFRPTPKSSFYGLALVAAPMALFIWFIKNKRDEQEHKLRTGQVAYRDRRFKFQ
ncbi:uncharacterized protein LOC126248418 [Schistocerca nitens]|uniref:uncharacterized protein LOC126248418 n=1 Tax=Schistocerca nitens TaxID=7011 RepID=UPI002118033F|nr:uncharacterized protein LOC126248418 [Schistocerca nitens]